MNTDAANPRYTATIALIVALGGFLMGFDASVISGVIGFVEAEFDLSKIQVGWTVSSLALTATAAMMVAGPLSDRMGRRPVLMIAALLFAISAIASAVATNFTFLIIARMLGGFGVGAALIIAPMYIAEMAPAENRGRMVSFNQLNIVIGISAAFFSNYLILSIGESGATWANALGITDAGWRWMLGIETLPAVLYFFALFLVPESPRWLTMRGREDEALDTLRKVNGDARAKTELAAIHASIAADAELDDVGLRDLFHPTMKLVLVIGVSVGVLQQITGINSVFFYAPMIFEQSGIGQNASFMQAVLVGLVNLVFTVVAMAMIDKLGRRPLLGFGLSGIAVCMLLLSYGFSSATYTLDADDLGNLPAAIEQEQLTGLIGETFNDEIAFREAVAAAIGPALAKEHRNAINTAAIEINARLILFAILGFVASFAMSIGPIMWVLFSELFPNRVRGMAISFVGLINSATAFLVTLVFPWELENFGNATTFLIYGVIAVIGLVFVMRILPETKGRSLEQLEQDLVKG